MIAKDNYLLSGASGTLQNLVFRRVGDRTIISMKPRGRSKKKMTEKQKHWQQQMSKGIRWAKGITNHPQSKQRACESLQVPPNKVFRAIVKLYLLTEGNAPLFKSSDEELENKKTTNELKAAIVANIPESELMLFGKRAKGTYSSQDDWDILILTANDIPNNTKWDLQEKLLAITLKQGARLNMTLVQKEKWTSDAEFGLLRKRIEGELVLVK